MNEIIVAGVALLTQVVEMIQQAKSASQEQSASILARLQAASLALATAQDAAHQAIIDETAKDQALK